MKSAQVTRGYAAKALTDLKVGGCQHLLIERTQAGLQRAKAEGATFGRPATLDATQRDAVRMALATGASVSALAKQHGTSCQTIMRARDAAPAH